MADLSWIQTICLSAVSLTSSSIPSASCLKASLKAEIEFSGASSDAPL
tara:strand:- start:421 stop:564 length:144 start_codon:yes stop_codon:yes gene_type:complete